MDSVGLVIVNPIEHDRAVFKPISPEFSMLDTMSLNSDFPVGGGECWGGFRRHTKSYRTNLVAHKSKL